MSSYYEYKVLRLPLDKVNLRGKSEDDLEDLFRELNMHFELTPTSSDRWYIDFILEEGYDGEGDWGIARILNQKERQYAELLFSKLDIRFDADDIHYVEYCYYNCSEPQDYYEVIDISDKLKEIWENV